MTNTVQVDPRGWVPTASSIPFFRSQGYGDAFAAMALNHMLDVKDAIDSLRFVAIPMSNDPSVGGTGKVERPQRLIAKALTKPSTKRGTSGGKKDIFVPILDTSKSGDASDDEEPDIVNYDFNCSIKELPRRSSENALSEMGSKVKLFDGSMQESATIYTHPPPTM
jgi:hypothetical protein